MKSTHHANVNMITQHGYNYLRKCTWYFSIISKFTTAALSRTKSDTKCDKELSLLERVLAREGDTKVASILALDLFLVGVDTVSEECLVINLVINYKKFFYIYMYLYDYMSVAELSCRLQPPWLRCFIN